MLRKKLFLALLPAFLLLVAASIFALSSQKTESGRYEQAQEQSYRLIALFENLSASANQLERAERLLRAGEGERAQALTLRALKRLQEGVRELEILDPEQYPASLQQLKTRLQSVAGLDPYQAYYAPRLSAIADEVDLLVPDLIEHELRNTLATVEQFKGRQARITLVTIALLAGGLGLLAIAIFQLSKRILAPIDQLTAEANRVGEGNDWEASYQPSSKGEIGTLEVAFAQMATRIQSFKSNANLSLQRARKRTEDCLNGYPHPVYFFNKEKVVIYQNPAARELNTSTDWQTRLPPEIDAALNSVLRKGEEVLPTEFEETITLSVSSSKRHYLPICFEIEGDASSDSECALILQDITELQLSDQLKSDMVATVSHELKTPVTSVSIALHMLAEQEIGPLNELQLDLAQTAISDLDRLMKTLEHLLQIARLESHAPRLQKSELQVGELIQSVIDAHGLTSAEKAITIGVEIEKQLPRIRADRKALEIVLSNFLSNAIKYSPEGSAVTLYARRTSDAKRITLGASDQGPGIPEAELDRAFDKFYRSSRQSEKDGIGLGLSIVKDIAHAHGGSVACRLNEQGGCDFLIELPL